MKRKKIIYINTRFHYSRPLPEMEQDEKWFYLYGMGHIMAAEMLKKDRSVLVENWRADHAISERKEKMVNGIMCRIFPCKNRAKLGDFSLELIKELKTQAKQFQLVIHIIGMHIFFYDVIAWALRGQALLVVTHLGGGNPCWHFQRTRKIRTWIYSILQNHVILPCYGHVICTTETQREYVAGIIGNDRVTKMPIFGVDLELLQPRNKIESRCFLGFPRDKKIILQVGRAVRVRGVDIVLDTWNKIKSSDLFFYMIDAHEEDELFSMVLESGVPFCGTVNYHDLPIYYNAADILIYLPFDDESIDFAGTSYVPLEAMACGTPVVATTLRHFPDEDIKSVCRIPYEVADVVPMVLDLLQNPSEPERCRSLIKKYYNWDSVIIRHIEIYQKLLDKQ